MRPLAQDAKEIIPHSTVCVSTVAPRFCSQSRNPPHRRGPASAERQFEQIRRPTRLRAQPQRYGLPQWLTRHIACTAHGCWRGRPPMTGPASPTCTDDLAATERALPRWAEGEARTQGAAEVSTA